MEASTVFACTGFVAAFFAGTCLLPLIIRDFGSARRTARAQSIAVGHGGYLAALVRNGAPALVPLIGVLAKNHVAAAFFERLRWYCEEKGLVATEESAATLFVAFELLIVVAGSLIAASPVFGLIVAACLVILVNSLVNQLQDRQKDAMREAIPDVLRSMSSCFHSGYTLLQTFRELAQESKGPLKGHFVRAASDLETGMTAEETLRKLRDSSAIGELAFVTVALEVQHRTGGSLQQIIDTACDSVENELELRRSLKVQTAQARLSARVVTAMPFVLIGVFSLISKDFLMPFFSSPLGIAILAVALTMQVIGIVCVRHLLDVGEV